MIQNLQEGLRSVGAMGPAFALWAVAWAGLPAVLSAQDPQVRALRVEAGSLRLDGALDETAWSRADPATGFVQREPEQGAPATEATEVRFAYDDDALWIGARMRSDDPSGIRSLVTRRDREGSSEQLVVSLDTHRDRRTAYSFGVTPAGVRIDYYHGSDFERNRDYGYDPVWQVRTATGADGWTAEIRIPFSQLRFDPENDQAWGVNIVRNVPARNEQSYWVLVGRNETGWASRMGELVGLTGLRSSRGVELLPYVAANGDIRHAADAANPFLEERGTSVRMGADLKMGSGRA